MLAPQDAFPLWRCFKKPVRLISLLLAACRVLTDSPSSPATDHNILVTHGQVPLPSDGFLETITASGKFQVCHHDKLMYRVGGREELGEDFPSHLREERELTPVV